MNKLFSTFTFTFILLAAVFSFAVLAETIVFKDGRKIEAKIVAATTNSLTVESQGNRASFPLSEIDSIDGKKITYQHSLAQKPGAIAAENQQRYVAFLMKGQEYLQGGDYAKAVSQFQAALEINDSHISAYSGIAAAYLSLNQFDKAVEYADKGIAADSEFPNIYGIRAQVFLNMGNVSAAKKDLLKARSLLENPDKYPANDKLLEYVNSMIAAIDAQEDAREAQKMTSRPIPAVDSTEIQYWQYLDQGQAYFRMGQYLSAIDEYEKAIEINPADSQGYLYLGQAFEAIQRNEKAKQAYEKAIAANSKDKEAHYSLAILYNRAFRDNKTALQYLKDAVEIDPEYAEAYHNLGILASSAGEKKEAAVYLKRAVEIFRKRGAYHDAEAVQQDLINIEGSRTKNNFFSLTNIGIGLIIALGLAAAIVVYGKKRAKPFSL
jgi:tetratricopeptide (TPR) repeat protein